ncbi:MAG: hypothetical protein WCD53_31105, partial [Microcoleus sp.]
GSNSMQLHKKLVLLDKIAQKTEIVPKLILISTHPPKTDDSPRYNPPQPLSNNQRIGERGFWRHLPS